MLWIRIGSNADPDPAFYLNADPDPDPAFYLNADPDPDPAFYSIRIRIIFVTCLPVSCVLGNLALPVALAVVAQLLADGSLEEPLAAFAADGPVVST